MRSKNTFSISFYVKKHRVSQGKVPVYCRVTVNGVSRDISIKRKIELDRWDNNRGNAKGSRNEIKALNAYLEQVRNRLYESVQDLEKERKLLTAESVKNRYLGKDDRGKTLKQLIEYHNEEMKDELAWGTQKNYYTTQKYILEFLSQKNKTSDIYLTELNYKFIKDFEKFLKTRKPTDHQKPCGQNGAMKHIERLKKMVNLGIKEEWLLKDPFQKFKLKFEKKERGFLTKDELQRIEEKPFKIQRLAQVRDIFIFCCYTGLSYVEVYNLTHDHVIVGLDGKHWIQGQRKKSGEWFKVPILPQAQAIIDKYKDNITTQASGKLLPVFTNQKTNAYLKEIADLCRVEKNLTFHLARHTFATTVTLANGVPIESVSKMLGHTSLRTTQVYAKVVEEKLSNDMRALEERLTSNLSNNVSSLKKKEM